MSLFSAGIPAASQAGPQAVGLYDGGGIRPEAVKQGAIGSCYFHSVVAALAATRPKKIEKMIKENGDGTFTVRFPDGKAETAYGPDIGFARQSGYDLSDGLWVAVLFRAYAQRTLRQSLASAIERSDLFSLGKKYAEDFIETNDPLLLAYDRAIREHVDQAGKIDRAKLEAGLKQQLEELSLPEQARDSFVKMLDSGGFLDSLALTIKENGEIFGAYRAVGQGGLPGRVLKTLDGAEAIPVASETEDVASALENATSARRPAVACTGGSRLAERLAKGEALPAGAEAWYINAHCYTVLGYDSVAKTVTLRNPWAHHPDPDGVTRILLQDFTLAFRGVVSSSE